MKPTGPCVAFEAGKGAAEGRWTDPETQHFTGGGRPPPTPHPPRGPAPCAPEGLSALGPVRRHHNPVVVNPLDALQHVGVVNKGGKEGGGVWGGWGGGCVGVGVGVWGGGGGGVGGGVWGVVEGVRQAAR